MKNLLTAIAALALLSACATTSTPTEPSAATAPASTPATATTPTPDGKVTLADYSQVKTGMTQAEVEAILGPGSEMSRVEIPGTPVTVMYMWQNSNGSNMNATFQDGKVVTLAQFGLK